MYQNVWVVFDKDDFDDFDKAIQTANSKGYQVAWSNQSFEYWIYLHFYYSNAALHRNQWIKKLNDIFKQRQLGTGEYLKNCEDIFESGQILDCVSAEQWRKDVFRYYK